VGGQVHLSAQEAFSGGCAVCVGSTLWRYGLRWVRCVCRRGPIGVYMFAASCLMGAVFLPVVPCVRCSGGNSPGVTRSDEGAGWACGGLLLLISGMACLFFYRGGFGSEPPQWWLAVLRICLEVIPCAVAG